MAYLIDTDILIYSLKDDEVVTRRFAEVRSVPKSISVISYGELVFGARRSTYVEKNLAVAYRVAEIFPIIDVTRSVMDVFAELKDRLQRDGTRLEDMDLFIAATALSHNLTLVTNNEKHFSRISGLKIENWKSG